MKLFAFALVAALFVGTRAIGFDLYFKSPEHPGKCVYLDVIVAPGEHAEPKGVCERFTCAEDLKGQVESCDDRIIILEPPCWWGDLVDPDAAFPDCCMKKVICPPQLEPVKPDLE